MTDATDVISVSELKLDKIETYLKQIANKKTQEIVLKKSDPIEIKFVNEATKYDVMTAWGTFGAVIVAVLVGVIVPLFVKLFNWWKRRPKLKLKFIEYCEGEKDNNKPYLFMELDNLYNETLTINSITFYMKFNTHVLPIVLNLKVKDNIAILPLTQARLDFYFVNIYNTKKLSFLNSGEEIKKFINKTHIRRNKISEYDKIKSAYFKINTNLGIFDLKVPKWMYDASVDSIFALFLDRKLFKFDTSSDKEHLKDRFFEHMQSIMKIFAKGYVYRKKELWCWKYQDFLEFTRLYIFTEFWKKLKWKRNLKKKNNSNKES